MFNKYLLNEWTLYFLLTRRPEVAICELVSPAVAHSLLSQGCTSGRLQSGSHLCGPLRAHLKRKQEPKETLTSKRGKRVRKPQQVMPLESLGDNPRVRAPGSLLPYMEQQTGSKLGKSVYCHPAYLTSMQSTSWEMLGWMKHKLESRLPGEISITSDMQVTPPL